MSSLPASVLRSVEDADAGLLSQVDFARLPRHIAIIMDGNGRWARRRRLPRIAGHRAGAQAVRDAVESCSQLGVKALTLYAFSTENWKRPRTEIDTLMELLREYIRKELAEIHRNNIRLQILGRYEQLPREVREDLEDALRQTAPNTGMVLNVALTIWESIALVISLLKSLLSMLEAFRTSMATAFCISESNSTIKSPISIDPFGLIPGLTK